ncbi:MAG TPA: NAD(P)H-dependent oxidoreductase subunit E [Armatimonadota bacterium]|jgi:NADH:ubiquinone oxidoreductase subunit E
MLSEAALAECKELISHYPEARCAMLPVLWVFQREYGYLTRDAMVEAATLLRVRPVEVFDVASFYFMFRQEPIGKRIVSVCGTLSCALNGAYPLVDRCREILGIGPGESTPDGKVHLEIVECLGACSDAPCVAVDYYQRYKVTPEILEELLQKVKKGEPVEQEWRDPEQWRAPSSPNGKEDPGQELPEPALKLAEAAGAKV